ncbi:MAG: phage head closure protein [Saccharothrix sp.]|nr:phage head closure protein [Saccharothrix sp.]
MSTPAHTYNRELQVWRTAAVDDGAGGQITTPVLVGTVRAKVDQPSAAERMAAQQGGAEHTHTVYLAPDADVGRGDELRGSGQRLRVLFTVQPSRPVYLKAGCELIQQGD